MAKQNIKSNKPTGNNKPTGSKYPDYTPQLRYWKLFYKDDRAPRVVSGHQISMYEGTVSVEVFEGIFNRPGYGGKEPSFQFYNNYGSEGVLYYHEATAEELAAEKEALEDAGIIKDLDSIEVKAP